MRKKAAKAEGMTGRLCLCETLEAPCNGAGSLAWLLLATDDERRFTCVVTVMVTMGSLLWKWGGKVRV